MLAAADEDTVYVQCDVPHCRKWHELAQGVLNWPGAFDCEKNTWTKPRPHCKTTPAQDASKLKTTFAELSVLGVLSDEVASAKLALEDFSPPAKRQSHTQRLKEAQSHATDQYNAARDTALASGAVGPAAAHPTLPDQQQKQQQKDAYVKAALARVRAYSQSAHSGRAIAGITAQPAGSLPSRATASEPVAAGVGTWGERAMLSAINADSRFELIGREFPIQHDGAAVQRADFLVKCLITDLLFVVEHDGETHWESVIFGIGDTSDLSVTRRRDHRKAIALRAGAVPGVSMLCRISFRLLDLASMRDLLELAAEGCKAMHAEADAAAFRFVCLSAERGHYDALGVPQGGVHRQSKFYEELQQLLAMKAAPSAKAASTAKAAKPKAAAECAECGLLCFGAVTHNCLRHKVVADCNWIRASNGKRAMASEFQSVKALNSRSPWTPGSWTALTVLTAADYAENTGDSGASDGSAIAGLGVGSGSGQLGGAGLKPEHLQHLRENGLKPAAQCATPPSAPAGGGRGPYRCKKCKQFKIDPETGKSHVCMPAASEKPEPPKPPPKVATCTGGAGVGVDSAIDM
jgi:hypothetical protein